MILEVVDDGPSYGGHAGSKAVFQSHTEGLVVAPSSKDSH